MSSVQDMHGAATIEPSANPGADDYNMRRRIEAEDERDQARRDAYVLADAWLHDRRPPDDVVARALRYGPGK